MEILTSFFAGDQLAQRELPSEAVIDAEARLSAAQKTISAAADKIKRLEEAGGNWARYAGRLRMNLEARKHSEATLFEKLKEANVNHPLATQEGFEQLFEQALVEQYGKVDADRKGFAEVETERMQQSAAGPRDSVR